MSRESRQRLRAEAKQREKRLARQKQILWLLPFSVLVLAVAGTLVWIMSRPNPQTITKTEPSQFHQPRTLKELLALPPNQIEHCDIGLMNLLCAKGLSGAADLNVQDCLKKLDGLAARVKFETDRHYYRFREHPEQFRNSLGYYRMMMLEQVLVQDLGIQYNPDLALPQMDGQVPTMASGVDSKNIFIHGLLNGNHLGTCASMPVLIVAIGRRLDYPVNLAGAKLHLYVRYEDYNGKHFNVEPTVTEGFFTPSDDDYKNGNGRLPRYYDRLVEPATAFGASLAVKYVNNFPEFAVDKPLNEK